MHKSQYKAEIRSEQVYHIEAKLSIAFLHCFLHATISYTTSAPLS